jgi:hypothetical protein
MMPPASGRTTPSGTRPPSVAGTYSDKGSAGGPSREMSVQVGESSRVHPGLCCVPASQKRQRVVSPGQLCGFGLPLPPTFLSQPGGSGPLSHPSPGRLPPSQSNPPRPQLPPTPMHPRKKTHPNRLLFSIASWGRKMARKKSGIPSVAWSTASSKASTARSSLMARHRVENHIPWGERRSGRATRTKGTPDTMDLFRFPVPTALLQRS